MHELGLSRNRTCSPADISAWHSHRALNKTVRKAIDSMVRSYSDSGTAVARRAGTALERFSHLKELHLHGLDSAALQQLLPALARSAVSQLALPCGTFSASAIFLPPPAPHDAPVLGRVTRLDLTRCYACDDLLLEWFALAAPQMEELEVSCTLALAKPIITLPSLRVLALYLCANLEDAAVAHICRSSPLVEDLNLWRCTSLCQPAITGSRLSRINVSECFELCDEASALFNMFGAGPSALSCLLAAGCSGLRAPVIVGHPLLLQLDLSSTDLDDEAISTACAAAPLLQRLDMSHCRALRSPVIGGPTLRSLFATGCDGLTDDAVSGACRRSPALIALRLSMCTSLSHPVICVPSLVEAHLCGCSALQDWAVSQLCAGSPRLTSVGLKLCFSLVAPHLLSPSLHKLDLSLCERLRDPRIGGGALLELQLAGCAQLQDSALEAACELSPLMQRLDVSRCASLSAPILRCPSLEWLGCDSIAPEARSSFERSEWWQSCSLDKAHEVAPTNEDQVAPCGLPAAS
jgi:hypothetical protein